MEVRRRYSRTRRGTRGHVSPANQRVEVCLTCPVVTARARVGVPVSYPRTVVSSSNSKHWDIRQGQAKRGAARSAVGPAQQAGPTLLANAKRQPPSRRT